MSTFIRHRLGEGGLSTLSTIFNFSTKNMRLKRFIGLKKFKRLIGFNKVKDALISTFREGVA
jgi:hypothetical protein